MNSRAVEVDLADLAAAQWGLVTTNQATTAGLSRTQLNRLAANGTLIHLAHGVYAIRTAAGDDLLDLRCAWLTLDPTRLAADRLADHAPTAVVSHASAALLHGHGDLLADRHEFTVTTRKQTRRPELRLHRGALPASDVTVHSGLPVTTPGRTVLDLLTAHHDGEHVADVLADAVRAHQVDLEELAARLGPFAARFGFRPHNGEAVLAHLLKLGDVTHEVEAARAAAGARMAGIPFSDYYVVSPRARDSLAALNDSISRQFAAPVDALLVTLQTNAILENEALKAALASINRQATEPLEALAAAVGAPQSAQVNALLQSPAMKTALASINRQATEPLEALLATVRGPVVEQARAALQSPSMQAQLKHLGSSEAKAQLDAVRRVTQR